MNSRFRQAAASASLAILLLMGLLPAVALGQSIESEILAMEDRITEAKRDRLHLIAPEAYKEASKELAGARDRFSRGGKIEDIRKQLAKVDAKLDRCEGLREIGDLLLRNTFTARDDAISAKAPEFATEPWKNAEEVIREAGQKIEDGKQNDARQKADESARLYREAELLAIRVDILGKTKVEREKALAVKADELAPVTMGAAERDLASAEKILQGDRYMTAQAQELAEAAGQEFRHAALIAGIATSIDKDRKNRPESVVRQYEAQFARVAKALGYDPRFDEGIEVVADQILSAATSMSEERKELVGQLTELQAEMESLRQDLARLEDRDAALQSKERYDRKLREVREVFGADEAEVLVGDNELIIRLYGLSFPVGTSEIRPENFALLTRLQRALREFPTSPVAIEGHTDSQGDENMNQSLSDQRAEAVRTYLLANMGTDSKLLAARGYGESRPIANNESEAGRARNRRIDVVVRLDATIN